MSDLLGLYATAAAPTRPIMRLLDFKPVRKNSLRGFASIKLPNGLIISDVVVGETGDRQWALLPSKAMIDRDGELMRDGAAGRATPRDRMGLRARCSRSSAAASSS